jgi:NADPH-dependent 2,4-dienoyl-CoA reductase/sulfur reductase-like enzyme
VSEAVVLVCGGGAAGMAAALAAARAGARVALVEARPQLGGTVADALIHTLGGLYDSAGHFINGGLAVELAERLADADKAVRQRRLGRTWVLNACPEVYRRVTSAWVAAQPRLDVCCGCRLTAVTIAEDRVIEARVESSTSSRRMAVRGLIDATGTAAVVRLIDPALVADDAERAAGGLIFRLRGLEPGTLSPPRNVAVLRALRAAAAGGRLPADCDKAWVDSGVDDDEAYVKLFVADPQAWDPEQARATVAAVVGLLRRLPGFGGAMVDRIGCVGVRDGGRIRGDYCLTADDVRAGRRFDDAACRCPWPIEYWHPVRGATLEYLPEDVCYEIPLRALRVRGLRNVWAAGKCLSADRFAHASARVAGTCWSMGEAVGKAACGLA